ncbi:MAG: hypothetical protein Q9168_006281 [Polycauliona sp. 1 TL-2023]
MVPSKSVAPTSSDVEGRDTDENFASGETIDLTDHDISPDRLPLPSDKHIRLVQISAPQTGTEQTAANLRFVHVRSDKAPAYKALSYTWGPPTSSASHIPDTPPVIRSNQQECRHITPNLEACLKELVILSPGLWWIDALCINQDDPVEKSQQVGNMRNIYAQAEETYVWLGPKLDDGETAIEMLEKLDQLEREESILGKDASIRHEYYNSDSVDLPKMADPAWRSLLTFLNRSYFERIWVVQELVVARNQVTVLCGDITFTWKVLSTALGVIDHLEWRGPLLTLAEKHGISIATPAFALEDAVTILQRSRGKLGLEVSVSMCRSFRATDPRDKIIALLGFATEAEKALKELSTKLPTAGARIFSRS